MKTVILSQAEQETMSRIATWLRDNGGHAPEDQVRRQHPGVMPGDMRRFYASEMCPFDHHTSALTKNRIVVMRSGKLS